MRDPAEHPVDRYRAAVARTLRLPPSLEADRLDEIAIHIDDTVASLIDEGLDRAHAEREALARLGSPEVLGDELRRAEQTARRALAAVGGGIVAAAGGVIRGSIVGFLALFSTFVGGALLVQAVAHLTGWQVNPVLPVSNAGAYVSIAWLAAFLGARSAAEAIARGSRRRIVDVRAPVAVAATAVAVWVVATWQLEQDWLSVAALLALPALAAIGPFAGHDDPAGPRGWSRAWFVAAAAALLLPVVLLSGVGGGVTGAGPGVGQS
ncbi:MAG TPA: permease prefix domain 1-containing protein, partial [Candidatus Limnocylindrales bacterium]|nr:permease prefix domain 1-containing protein [Candidatus Limnocylindrales bacterium]